MRADPHRRTAGVPARTVTQAGRRPCAAAPATITIDTCHQQTASHFPKNGNLMPLFTVTMRSGRTVTEKDAISTAIHEASVSAGYPDDDHFQRFICLEQADLRIGPLYPDLQKPRSGKVLMIEVLLSSGTTEDRKRLLLSAIVTRLQAAGTDPNDVMVFFTEVDRASSSFAGGRPAQPVEAQP